MSRKKKSDPGNFHPLGNVVIVSSGIWKTKPVASQPRLRLADSEQTVALRKSGLSGVD